MENIYTEDMLKELNKTQLLEIASENEIKADKNIKNDDLIAMILEKGCPISDGGDKPDDPDDECDCEDESVPKFSKEQLLKSNWYSHRRDVLTTLLEDDKLYSHADVCKMVDKFMKGTVN